MVDLPQVNTAQLSNGLANLAKKGIGDFANSSLGNLDTINDGAKAFGVSGLDGFINSIKTFVFGLLAQIGIHAGDTAAPAAATSAVTPPATPNPAAAQAAATAAAAGTPAAGGTHVAAAGAPPVTPSTPKPPRAVS